MGKPHYAAMNIGSQGLELIKSFEQLMLEAYMPTPHDVWTIGYGHTKNVGEGDTCTEAQADAWLAEDLAWAEACVSESVTHALEQAQFDALVSFTFNCGCAALKSSSLLKLCNLGDMDSAALQFARWNKQKGTVLAGLTRRRAAEAALFG